MGRGLIIGTLLALVACSEGTKAASPDAGKPDAGDLFAGAKRIEVTVPTTGRTFLSLADPEVVQPADPASSTEWDLAFEGWDVHTNSGPSGTGKGAAFGPLDSAVMAGDSIPEHPFVTPDEPGGAFVGWYLYSGAPDHVLYSRGHVYGVRSGGALYKVQIRSYYSERDGAPVSALYELRYARLSPTPGPTVVVDRDGTAGGSSALPSVASECIDLATGAKLSLTPAEARASSAWDLCVRRDAVSVDGEIGGPRGVGAVDLDAAKTASETLATVSAAKDVDLRARFDAVGASDFDGRSFRGDRVVSVFDGGWYENDGTKMVPKDAVWLVQGANGSPSWLVAFATFLEPTTASPGTVVVWIKPVH